MAQDISVSCAASMCAQHGADEVVLLRLEWRDSISSEYCDRPIDDKGSTCKDMGAINLWNEKRKEVFTLIGPRIRRFNIWEKKY
ncbi:MAG: hypothetical protein K0R92_927 [Lachnospiraceae bacterium]|jgi:hypothetical protein|nr:hypothetical protein [Lachnospiraceae bacterium]